MLWIEEILKTPCLARLQQYVGFILSPIFRRDHREVLLREVARSNSWSSFWIVAIAAFIAIQFTSDFSISFKGWSRCLHCVCCSTFLIFYINLGQWNITCSRSLNQAAHSVQLEDSSNLKGCECFVKPSRPAKNCFRW